MPICTTKAEIRKAKEWTAGTLVIPVEAGYVGEIGDVVEVKGADPVFQGLCQLWHGTITSKTDKECTITGRFWIGSEAALKLLAGELVEAFNQCPTP